MSRYGDTASRPAPNFGKRKAKKDKPAKKEKPKFKMTDAEQNSLAQGYKPRPY